MTQTAEYLRRSAEYAPRTANHANGLRGWWTPDGTYICAADAARVMARGCMLPQGSEAVWADKPEPFGVCCVCEEGQ